MGKKFDTVFEAVIQRYQAGGYLPGDIVTFRTGYKSTPTYNAMHSKMKKELDDLATSGLTIRVVQIGDKLGGQSSWNQHKTADSVVITIAGDQGGGRSYGSITVSPDMIDCVDQDNNFPAVPDQHKRKDDVIIKPVPYEIEPKFMTNTSDKGNGKNTPTNLKLAGESTTVKKDNKELVSLYETINTK